MLERAGAALVLDENGLTASALAEALGALLGDAARRGAMAQASRTLGRPEAAATIADGLFTLQKKVSSS
jgi:UDP-N-acetylglucosamine--N-acetylmuramyl-(pentapeptide) pyrophosphoryl-undecaprenol N-acetylglucosamine transferase